MSQKHLIIALGTTGGEVALALKSQMAQRPIKDFYYKACYMDTSDSLRRGGKIADSEFIHLTANQRYMDNAIADTTKKNPYLQEILYPNFPPPPSTGNGAGNIRYSAAATLTVPATRSMILSKISTFIDQLAIMGDKRRDISFSIILSAVGATGSGTVELLLPLVLEAATNAGISKPNCDIVILHPLQNETRKLLLANAEALYAELAVAQGDPLNDRFTGRKLIVGSGGQAYSMNTLADLEKTAATLLRLTCDPISGIMQHYWDSLPNRHVLRELENETLIPTHLSSATPITIGLANLGQQVIQVDIARLISHLVLGPIQPDRAQKPANTLLANLNFLRGNDNNSSYKLLLEKLTASVRSYLENEAPLETSLKSFPPQQQADRLRQSYRNSQEYITNEGARRIPEQAQIMYKQLIEKIREERNKYIMGDRPVTQLLNDFREMQERIRGIQAAAADIKVSPVYSEEEVQQFFDALARRKQTVSSLLRVMQDNLTRKCEAEAVQTATELLNALEGECVENIRRLQSFVNHAYQHYEHKSGWNTGQPVLDAESDYPLYISALSTPPSIAQYYDRVSIFTKNKAQQGFLNTLGQQDPLAIFREALEKQNLLQHFFDGHYEQIFEEIEKHVNERVQKRIEGAPLLDILEFIGGSVLQIGIKQALERAQALIPFTREYAANSIEEWFVTASWSNEGQRLQLERAMKQVSEAARLFRSDDPTEIVVFYLIDGLSMPAINDLAGHCFQPFLDLRATWTRSKKLLVKRKVQTPRQNAHNVAGIPIYSGYGVEERIREQGIISSLYKVKSDSVGEFTTDMVPELEEPEDLDFVSKSS